MSIWVHVVLILPLTTVVVKREALVAERRQQRHCGIAVARRRRQRAHRHRLQPLPSGARHEDRGGSRGGPGPGPAVEGKPGLQGWQSRRPPPRSPHRARQDQTGRTAAGTCSPSRPRALRAQPIRAGTSPASPWRRVEAARALSAPAGCGSLSFANRRGPAPGWHLGGPVPCLLWCSSSLGMRNNATD